MGKRPLGQILIRVIRFTFANILCIIACVIEEAQDDCSTASSFPAREYLVFFFTHLLHHQSITDYKYS